MCAFIRVAFVCDREREGEGEMGGKKKKKKKIETL